LPPPSRLANRDGGGKLHLVFLPFVFSIAALMPGFRRTEICRRPAVLLLVRFAGEEGLGGVIGLVH